MSVDQVIEAIAPYPQSLVLVTGGEPLAQADCIALLERLIELHLTVQVETSGAFDVSNVPPSVQKVLDIKTPGSGEETRNLWANLALLQGHDEIKFVLTSREDYLWCKEIIEERLPDTPATILLSPAYGQLQPADLSAWILADNLPVRLNMQIHKIIWGADVSGV
jgi:7-carboxy-7-deazaguanine synthase